MKKKITICAVIIAVVVAIAGIVTLSVSKNKTASIETADMIFEASASTGSIGEKIIGNPDKAKVIIYEYADFACSHCAEWNRKINEIIDEHGEDVSLVFRSFDLGFANGPAAARAATAAQIQGYFKAYKDLLFNNQSEWFYEKGESLKQIFSNYLMVASKGAADIDKFVSDMNSNSVKERLKFEQSLGKKIELTGTPTFRIDGETISPGEITEIVEQKLSN